MTNNELITRVSTKPEIMQLSLPVAEGGLDWSPANVATALGDFVPSVVQEVSLAYEWDFAIKTAYSTSVINDPTYTLDGNNNNALAISTIYYNESGSPLKKRTKRWIDDHLARNTPVAVEFWYPSGRTNKKPIVTLVAAPIESGNEIKYDFWDSKITLPDFPPILDAVCEAALAKRVIVGYNAVYKQALGDAIAAYTRPSGETHPPVLDPIVSQQNQRKATRHGWGGGV